MSLIKQLVDEIQEILSMKSKWKLFTDESPDSSKIKVIYVWDGIKCVRIQANCWLLWQDTYGRLFSSTHVENCIHHKLENEFKCWRELIDSDKPPIEYR